MSNGTAVPLAVRPAVYDTGINVMKLELMGRTLESECHCSYRFTGPWVYVFRDPVIRWLNIEWRRRVGRAGSRRSYRFRKSHSALTGHGSWLLNMSTSLDVIEHGSIPAARSQSPE